MSRILILYVVLASFFSCQGNKQNSSNTETPPDSPPQEVEIKGGTAQDYAESLILALSTEDVSNFEKLIPSKDAIAESIASKVTDEEQKQKTLESFNDAAYATYRSNQISQFRMCLNEGNELGIDWPSATFEKLNFVKNTDQGYTITLGEIRFTDGKRKYLIQIRQGGKIEGLWYASYISTPKPLDNETE